MLQTLEFAVLKKTLLLIEQLPLVPAMLRHKPVATEKSLIAQLFIENVPADVVAESMPRFDAVALPKKKNSALSAVKLEVAWQST